MQKCPAAFTVHQIREGKAHSSKRICRILRRNRINITREGASLQKSSGDSGTPLRDNKAAMGVQLHPDKERDWQGKLRCRFDVHCL